ncbi:MAG: 4Fe-4S dicluster domain-containing protein [Bacillota bacterium]
MSVKKLSSKQLINLLKLFREKYQVIAPFKVEQGRLSRVVLREVYDEEDIPAIYLQEIAETTPKNHLLPRDEQLAPEVKGQDYKPERWQDKPRLFFGIRSCDLAAVELLDDVFLEDDYQDPFYRSKRENSIFIGYANQQLPPNNFQSELGIDYFAHDSASLFLYEDLDKEREDRYYLKISPEAQLPEEVEEFIQDVGAVEVKELEKMLEDWQKIYAEQSDFKINNSLPFSEKQAFKHADWAQPTASCLGCGVCTYYCPTCFCFDFFWEDKTKNRSWDSCMFSLFTEHASGHNPREEQHQRWRQRLMHKFSYHPQNYEGKPGCVGCGRCISKCPVNLDIRAVIYEVDQAVSKGGGTDEG